MPWETAEQAGPFLITGRPGWRHTTAAGQPLRRGAAGGSQSCTWPACLPVPGHLPPLARRRGPAPPLVLGAHQRLLPGAAPASKRVWPASPPCGDCDRGRPQATLARPPVAPGTHAQPLGATGDRSAQVSLLVTTSRPSTAAHCTTLADPVPLAGHLGSSGAELDRLVQAGWLRRRTAVQLPGRSVAASGPGPAAGMPVRGAPVYQALSRHDALYTAADHARYVPRMWHVQAAAHAHWMGAPFLPPPPLWTPRLSTNPPPLLPTLTLSIILETLQPPSVAQRQSLPKAPICQSFTRPMMHGLLRARAPFQRLRSDETSPDLGCETLP
ncbi:hypothetical protein CDD83_5745 [Cordyceps sp. RAO-2017]|nr:hypothetical protein CDD83_5745 [Cordyceps sp. RAO-2017]